MNVNYSPDSRGTKKEFPARETHSSGMHVDLQPTIFACPSKTTTNGSVLF